MAHDYSGYLMMPLALILVGIEILILSWLEADSGEEDEADAPRIDPVLARLGAAKAKAEIGMSPLKSRRSGRCKPRNSSRSGAPRRDLIHVELHRK